MNSNLKQDEPRYLIIPSAGLGTRMQAINPDLPKELLPLGQKPVILYAVEEGLSAGIKNIVVIIRKQKEIIRQYFEDNKVSKKMFPLAFDELQRIKKKCSVTFRYQKEPLGESDAISYAKDIVGSHAAAIIYPDDIFLPIPGALNSLKTVYCRYKTDVIALIATKKQNVAGLSDAGKVDITPINEHIYRIKRFLQKGKGQFVPRYRGELRSTGMSISGPHIFEYIEKLKNTIKEGEFTDFPVYTLILKEKGVLGCRLQGAFFDVGNPKGYELCQRYIKNRASSSLSFLPKISES